MTWEISHTVEAWECHRRGLEAQTEQWLREAIATCEADRQDTLDRQFRDACWELDINDDTIDAVPDWQWTYDRALKRLESELDVRDLVDECMRWTEINNSCSNGGSEFYVDGGGYYSITLGDYENET